MTRTLRPASSVVVEPATSSPKSRTCYDPSVTCRVAGSSSLKMEPMSEHSAWPCGTAGEWSVLTSHRRRSGQPRIMEHLQVVVGYDRVLTPAMSPIETSGNRARQLQRANWRACLPTASAILEDLSDPAFCMPDRPKIDETAKKVNCTSCSGAHDDSAGVSTPSGRCPGPDLRPGACGRTDGPSRANLRRRGRG